LAQKKSNYKEVLGKAEKDMRKRLSSALQNTAIEAIGRLANRTPVDTGAARFHWFVRALPDENFDKTRVDPAGDLAKQRAKRDVKLFTIGQIVYLVNAAPYFQYLEAGSSTQAPNGVVAITLAEMDLLWSKEVKAAFSIDPRTSPSGSSYAQK